tara:strand:+ start:142 stop:666 length:525 start_codon:yes stop_codon:yes gene_type:complete
MKTIKQIPTFGKKLNQLELQTNLPKGTFQLGDKHPIYPQLRFETWRAWGSDKPKQNKFSNRNPKGGEYWSTEKAWKARKAKSRIRTLEILHAKREYINNFKLESGCKMCGYNEIAYCLDLDHINPSTKNNYNHAHKLPSKPWKVIQELLLSDIYQVLCAICHRIKTYTNKETQK